jgi:hypothetical protein
MSDMKLIMEGWRGYLTEAEEEQILTEGLLDKIKSFFAKAPNVGSYDPQGAYDPGTYGAFAQGSEVLSAMAETGIQATKDNIQQVAAAALGAGSGKEKTRAVKVGQGLIGAAFAIAGVVSSPTLLPALGAYATAAGVGAAAWALIQAAQKDPSKAERHPLLSKFNIDPKWQEMLDNKLEDVIEKKYADPKAGFFIQQLQSEPNSPMISLNTFLQDYIKQNYDQRTVTKPQEA